MCLLIETIKINDSAPENIFWHNKRFNETRQELFGIQEKYRLEESIIVPEEFSKGVVKCRIGYGKEVGFIEYEKYVFRPVRTLKLVFGNFIQYPHKYRDRSEINGLFVQKADKDDILIIKNGLVSDSSYCNLVFSDGKGFFTPETPLLKGTKRAKYLSEGRIKEREIRVEDIKQYQEIHLINAFQDLGSCLVLTSEVR
jgi:4-amino-4-deoxychorismate lyase